MRQRLSLKLSIGCLQILDCRCWCLDKNKGFVELLYDQRSFRAFAPSLLRLTKGYGLPAEIYQHHGISIDHQGGPHDGDFSLIGRA